MAVETSQQSEPIADSVVGPRSARPDSQYPSEALEGSFRPTTLSDSADKCTRNLSTVAEILRIGQYPEPQQKESSDRSEDT